MKPKTYKNLNSVKDEYFPHRPICPSCKNDEPGSISRITLVGNSEKFTVEFVCTACRHRWVESHDLVHPV